jgi:hypothetical protein
VGSPGSVAGAPTALVITPSTGQRTENCQTCLRHDCLLGYAPIPPLSIADWNAGHKAVPVA